MMRTIQNRREFLAAVALVGASAVPVSLAVTNAQDTATPAASPVASPQASPMAGGGGAQTAVTVELIDIAFDPNEFTIAANTDVMVTLPNTGMMPHTFNINEHNNPNVPNLGVDVDVDPGDTGMATINAPAGDYYFWCDVPRHEEAGMHGIMHVVQ